LDDRGQYTDLISSASNPVIKLARQLASRRRVRHREGLFLIEGERAIVTAIQNGTDIQTVMIDDERRGDISPALVASLTNVASRVVSVTPALFTTIGDAEHPQPLIAIGQIPSADFPTHASGIVVLDAVRDPGNLGTIIRTACAAGIDGIALLPGCVDPYNPKSVRASAGTVTGIPIQGFQHIADLLARAFDDQSETVVIAADASGATNFRDVDWKMPIALVVGSEVSGLSLDVREVTSHFVRIPMAEGVESLNVSVATGVLLFEMRNARTAG
jgi:RNA methyltransferase, TrmH family